MAATMIQVYHRITERFQEIVLPIFFLQLFIGQCLLFLLLESFPDYRLTLFYGSLLSSLFLLLVCRRGAGFLPGILSMGLVLPTQLAEVPSPDTPVQVSVVGLPRYNKESLVSLPLRITSTPHTGTYLCKAIYLPWRNSHAWGPGTQGVIRARFRQFPSQASLTSYSGRMRRRGYRGSCRIHVMDAERSHESIIDRIRRTLRQTVRKAGTGHEGNAIILSLLLGVQDAAGQPLELAFKKLGLSHLLVVSGFHVSFVFAVLFGVLRNCALKSSFLLSRYSVATVVSVLAMVLTTLYVFVTGVTEPSLRALLALLVVLVARIRSMRGGTTHLLSFALTVVHLLWPAALCDVGVQFTVSALLGMRHASYQRQESLVMAYCRVTLYAGIYTGFIQMWWFGNLSLSGFLANPLLVPPILLLAAKGGAGMVFLLSLGVPGSHFLYQQLLHVLDMLCCFLRYLASFEGTYLEQRSTLALVLLAIVPLYEFTRCGYLWLIEPVQLPENQKHVALSETCSSPHDVS